MGKTPGSRDPPTASARCLTTNPAGSDEGCGHHLVAWTNAAPDSTYDTEISPVNVQRRSTTSNGEPASIRASNGRWPAPDSASAPFRGTGTSPLRRATRIGRAMLGYCGRRRHRRTRSGRRGVPRSRRVRGYASGRRRRESRVDRNAMEAARREPHRRAPRASATVRTRRGEDAPRDPRRRRHRAPAPGRVGASQRTHGVARRDARRRGARAEQPARRDHGLLAAAASQALAARGPHRARGDSPRGASLGDDREGPARVGSATRDRATRSGRRQRDGRVHRAHAALRARDRGHRLRARARADAAGARRPRAARAGDSEFAEQRGAGAPPARRRHAARRRRAAS